MTLLLVGCGDGGSGDGGPDTDATGNTETATVTDPSAGPASNPSDPSSDTSATDPDSSSSDPTMADSSSSGGDECTEKDECIVAEDCAPGQDCIGCLCFGKATGCAEWGMEGLYADCGDGITACMAPPGEARCLVDNADGAVCFYEGCETPCDCPQPPAGYEDAVECASVTMGDDIPDCFIGCTVSADCPDEMFCLQGTLCMFGEEPEPPAPAPAYSDCVNEEAACICLVDDTEMPTTGACGSPCDSDADCPAPDAGDSVPSCQTFTGNGQMVDLCILLCNAQTTCPDDMACLGGFCTWELVDEPPPPPPYGDCENNPVEEACAETDACIVAANDAGSVCAGPCEDVEDCADAPDSEAVLTCGDLGDGNVCHLSCALGEACPEGMDCFNATYCHYSQPR